MATVEIPILQGTNENSARDVSYMRCINWFVTPAANGSVGGLLPTPGFDVLASTGGIETRALMKFDDQYFCVVDDVFYELTFNAARTSLTATSKGTLASSSGVVSWARNTTQIMMVDGTGGGYVYNVVSDTYTPITDLDFTGGTTVVFLDGYFLYNTPGAATIYNTESNDGTLVSALSYATAEAGPDKVVGLGVDKNELWVFGENTVEIWYNAANATGSPFSRRGGTTIDQGCAAAHSIHKFDNGLIWLDDRGYVVRNNGYTPVIVSNEAISSAIQGYSNISDAIGMSYTDRGHLFYVLTFPTANVTWVYNNTTGDWHQWASWDGNQFNRHISNCIMNTGYEILMGGNEAGQIYKLNANTHLEGSNYIHRIKTTSHNMGILNLSVCEDLTLHLAAGKTTLDRDPQIEMRYSHDGGHTWSEYMARSVGNTGEYGTQVRWNRLGAGREWLFEFRFAEDSGIALIKLFANFTGGNA